MKKLITVKEYADLNNTSVQNIYQKIKREKLDVITQKDETGRAIKYIEIDEPEEEKENDHFPEEETNKTEEPKEYSGIEQNIIAFLQKQLEEKDRQLAEKDKQIEKIQQLLDQEQHLHARDNLLLEEYKGKEVEKEEVVKNDEPIGYKEPEEEPKGFWKKIGYWLTH